MRILPLITLVTDYKLCDICSVCVPKPNLKHVAFDSCGFLLLTVQGTDFSVFCNVCHMIWYCFHL